jgi:uncharacterized protein YecE (DUF72 family)
MEPVMLAANIRTGIGGWTFEPWRGTFYPDKLPQAKELAFASRALGTIEINGTYYRSQTPATYAKWASEVPDGFIFSLKGPRFATNRRVLAEAGESISRFLDSGPTTLGDRLGPMLWQFAPTKKFDPVDFGAFLELLPKTFDGRTLRHTVEVRHPTFQCAEFIALLREFEIPVVYADHPEYPAIADLTGDFVYARLQKGEDAISTGYPPDDIAEWAKAAATWAEGGAPAKTAAHVVGPASAKSKREPRDVFVYFIHGGKVRAPAAAQALARALGIPVAGVAENGVAKLAKAASKAAKRAT